MEGHPLVEGKLLLKSPAQLGRTPPASTSAADRAAPDYLIEATALAVERSKIVAGTRLDALLDAVVLAAEQVQDVRIGRLEHPPAPATGELFSGLLLTFFLETTLAGAIAAAFSRAVVSRLIRHQRVFMLAPKSPRGRDIAEHARYLAAHPDFDIKVGGMRYRKTTPEAFLNRRVTAAVERKDVGMYAAWVQGLATGSEAATTNMLAAAKTAAPQAHAWAFKPDVPPRLPGVPDTPGVALLAAAMGFRSVHHAASDYLHAAAQSFLRTTPAIALSDIEVIASTFEIQDLDQEVSANLRRRQANHRGQITDLLALRDQYRLVVEGMIWALLYNFQSRGATGWFNDYGTGFRDIPKDLVSYWRQRLEEPVRTWRLEVGGTRIERLKRDGMIHTMELGKWLVAMAREAQAMIASQPRASG